MNPIDAYISQLDKSARQFCRSGATSFGTNRRLLNREGLRVLKTIGEAVSVSVQAKFTAAEDALWNYRSANLLIGEKTWRYRERPDRERAILLEYSRGEAELKLDRYLARYPIGAAFLLHEFDASCSIDFGLACIAGTKAAITQYIESLSGSQSIPAAGKDSVNWQNRTKKSEQPLFLLYTPL